MKGVVDLIRGACEQFKFKTPYMFNELSKVEITFRQKKSDGFILIIVKIMGDCQAVPTSKNIYVTLNQQETLQFSTDTKAEVQLRALTINGTVFSSRIKKITVYPTLSETTLS